MENPMVLNCGHSFDKKSINEWLNKKNVCPICNKTIEGMRPNYQLKDVIENIK